jgi:Anti-sigma factor NepR
VSRGTPDMQVVPYDEQHVRRAIRTVIGNALRNSYGELLKEAIPSRLTELLRRFDEPDRGYSEAQE